MSITRRSVMGQPHCWVSCLGRILPLIDFCCFLRELSSVKLGKSGCFRGQGKEGFWGCLEYASRTSNNSTPATGSRRHETESMRSRVFRERIDIVLRFLFIVSSSKLRCDSNTATGLDPTSYTEYMIQ